MLEILKPLSAKKATSPEHGDLQTLLERLLLEVTSLNYRYFLQERLTLGSEWLCEPPLLANERQVSGLFAQALSSVCPVSRPEMAILRASEVDADESKSELVESTGRVDYFATYGRRSVAIELKRIAVGTKPSEWLRVQKRWSNVMKQSETALRYLSKHKREFGYRHPAAIGLLAIRVGRNVGTTESGPQIDEAQDDFNQTAEGLLKTLKPDFLARYTAPREMQLSSGWGRNGASNGVFPGIIFAATTRLRS